MTILLNNVSADITSEEFESKGGSAIVNIRADNFDNGIIVIQIASKNDSLARFATLTNGTILADTSVKIDYLPIGIKLRVILSNTSGAASNIFCDILQ